MTFKFNHFRRQHFLEFYTTMSYIWIGVKPKALLLQRRKRNKELDWSYMALNRHLHHFSHENCLHGSIFYINSMFNPILQEQDFWRHFCTRGSHFYPFGFLQGGAQLLGFTSSYIVSLPLACEKPRWDRHIENLDQQWTTISFQRREKQPTGKANCQENSSRQFLIHWFYKR